MPPNVHSILGASAADRWMHCPPSARLTAGMQDEETVFAAEGTAAHAEAEWKVKKALKMRAGKRPTSEFWTEEMDEATDGYATGQKTGASVDTLTNGLVQNATAFQEMGLD